MESTKSTPLVKGRKKATPIIKKTLKSEDALLVTQANSGKETKPIRKRSKKIVPPINEPTITETPLQESQEKKIEKPKIVDVIDDWRDYDFTKRIKKDSGSKRIDFDYRHALKCTSFHTERDKCFIKASDFLKKNPPRRNDYYKYVTYYIKTGRKLQSKFFRYDLKKLEEYYNKIDEIKKAQEEGSNIEDLFGDEIEDEDQDEVGQKKKIKISYNRFNIKALRNYVTFMVLKFEGEYSDSDDELFNVIVKGNREYNPLTKIPSVFRGILPFKVKEYDIKRAFPTFIDIELETNYRGTIYDILDKKKFAKLLNANDPNGNKDYYYNTIVQLEKVYHNRAFEVLTEDRFRTKGGAFFDFAKYEKDYIDLFVSENELIHFVRLHDSVFVLQKTKCKITTFGIVEFGENYYGDSIENEEFQKNYYYLDDEGKFKTSPVSYADFFEAEGFKRVSTSDDKIILLKDCNNVLKPFNHNTDLLNELKSNINEMPDEVDGIKNMIAFDYSGNIKKSLPLIKSTPLRFYQDKQYTFAVPFKNGLVIMNKSGKFETKEYNSVKGYFLEHIVQTRVFNYTDEIGDYEKSVKNVSGKDYEAFMTMIGYLSHSYKDPTMSPCIILTDEDADDINRNGGRCKSLTALALSEVSIQKLKGGKEFDPNYRFVFDDLEKGTKLYVIDDVPAGFNFEELFTNILGSISCQRKNLKAEQIKFEESPKFLITSNWIIPHSLANNSTNRRFVEYKFNNYYNKDRTPLTEFGRRFFVDWDEAEFNRFYSYIFRCVKLFFDKGLIKPIYDKEVDNYCIKFRNDALTDEFERILKPLLASKRPFKVTDFLKIYNDYQNPLKNERFFHANNVRELINVWLKHHEDSSTHKYWCYSKSDRLWVFNERNLSVRSVIEEAKLKKLLGNSIS